MNRKKYLRNIIIRTQTKTHYADEKKLKPIIRPESVRIENVYNVLDVLLRLVCAHHILKNLLCILRQKQFYRILNV